MATAQLDVDSNKFNLPVVKASAGPDGIVVSKLRNDGWVTLDPGFLTTAQCESKITYIDGKHSILRYCGYPIEQLCENSDFLEVAWLLRHGELPSRAEYEQFCADINHKTMVGEDFRTFMGSFPRSAHPMSVLASAINALATFYPDTTDISDNDQLDEAAKIIMAKARTIVSYIFRRRRDEPMLYPDYARGYVDDFLRMCFAVPYEPFESDPLYVHALGRLLIIHADHEQNCSTSVVRIAGSAHANLYSAVAAGVNALSGPLHGGANEAVLRQLKAIRDSGKSVAEFVRDAKENGQKISGLGHRVYKSYDPRAAIARKYLEKIMEREDTQKLPSDERALFAVATELEDIALNDEYFVSRNLYPNVDFYTGLIYRAIGFDPAMFTTLFALGRIPGWIAQYREMLADPNTKIGRPRQVYTGPVERDFFGLPHSDSDSCVAEHADIVSSVAEGHRFFQLDAKMPDDFIDAFLFGIAFGCDIRKSRIPAAYFASRDGWKHFFFFFLRDEGSHLDDFLIACFFK